MAAAKKKLKPWHQFSPSVIDPKLCLARVWKLGEGGQCTRPQKEQHFCTIHSREERWKIHGRVDGPVPPPKLAEFERFAARSSGSSRSRRPVLAIMDSQVSEPEPAVQPPCKKEDERLLCEQVLEANGGCHGCQLPAGHSGQHRLAVGSGRGRQGRRKAEGRAAEAKPAKPAGKRKTTQPKEHQPPPREMERKTPAKRSKRQQNQEDASPPAMIPLPPTPGAAAAGPPASVLQQLAWPGQAPAANVLSSPAASEKDKFWQEQLGEVLRDMVVAATPPEDDFQLEVMARTYVQLRLRSYSVCSGERCTPAWRQVMEDVTHHIMRSTPLPLDEYNCRASALKAVVGELTRCMKQTSSNGSLTLG
eukprot:TRINITY_DN34901_c0_g1_i1.p1 TRINITY_DN34901_c0_g1~~TRINITY_DN34901_c0_g1_i1.p1  ORF type:complete len:362 (-),score=88.61 TRINITY_DN34901_c0_g1_i1:82-1167(-)